MDGIDRLIAEPPAGGPGRGGRGDDYNGGYGDGRDESSGDLFSRQLMTGEVLEKGIPVKIDRRVLASLEPREVFTLHWNKGKMGESRAVHSPPVYTTRNINSELVASRSLLVHACCDGLRRNAAATV